MSCRRILAVLIMFCSVAIICQADPITGSGTSNYLSKFTGSYTVGNSIVYESGGNVGIGTTSPSVKLDVFGHGQVSGVANPNWRAVGAGDVRTKVQSLDSDRGYIGTESNHPVALITNNQAKVTIATNGNVGIGTASPASSLHVVGNYYDTVQIGSTGETRGVLRLGYDVANNFGVIDSVRLGAGQTNLVLNQFGGNVGIGTTSPSAKLTVKGGNIRVLRSDDSICAELGDGLDYAEGFNIGGTNDKVQPGTVLVIDTKNSGKLAVSDQAYDTKVAGIAAGANNLKSGVRLGVGGFDCDVALAGRVYCNVDATENAVQTGDLLTTSDMAGYAMKAADTTHRQGAILGKAMESLEKGKKGQILVLVTLQ